MREGASEIDHQIPQACFTSTRKEGFLEVLGAEQLMDIGYLCLVSMPMATTLSLG